MTIQTKFLPILVATLALAACKPTEPDKTSNTQAPEKPVLELLQSDLFTVGQQSITPTVDVSGTLDPKLSAQIRAKVPGVIEKQTLFEGNPIAKGQIFAKIDPTEARLKVQQSRAALLAQQAQAQQTALQLTNSERLFKQGFVSQTALDNAKSANLAAQSQVKVQQTQLKLAQQALKDTLIRAPFSGFVGNISTREGSRVNTDSPVFELINLDTMVLQAEVAPDQLSQLKTGMSAQVSSAGYTRTATLTRISPGSLNNSRTVSIFLEIKNTDHALKAGQFATASIETSKASDALLVPQTAIQEIAGESVVYVLENKKLHTQAVQTGNDLDGANQSNAMVEIRKGLKAGDVIVGSNLGPLPLNATVSVKKLKP